LEVAIMAAGMFRFTVILTFLLGCTYAFAGNIADSRITAEVILDGMTHFDADQRLKDYRVDILEITRETGRPEITQREKQLYFMAPNIYLTMVGERPESLSNDASFMLLLSEYELVRGPDEEIGEEKCFKVVATPRQSAYKKYTKTYFVSKDDYRKLRIVSIRSEMEYEFIRYQIDFFYDEYSDGQDVYHLVNRSEVTAYDNKGDQLLEQSNAYSNYEFDIGLTQKFFEDILEEYNIYFSEGT
jgi:hypothetical protein